MTARKSDPVPTPEPVTVAELLLALATYPLDTPVEVSDGYGASSRLLALVEGEHLEIWGEERDARPHHFDAEVMKVVYRTNPLDDFAAAKEFLEWLQGQHYGMPQASTGGGHNEPTTYRDLDPAELAEEFARRKP